ncbi:MAG: hypothetical protein IJF37_05170 [Lachnospiraceae bacterium]|nr:hypothetical protein [Lachnospiraceae bacterium]
MQFDMETNLKGTNRVLMKLWRSIYRVRTKIIEVTQFFLLLACIMCILIKDYPLALHSGIILIGCMLIYLSSSINAMKKAMDTYKGKMMKLGEQEFELRDKSYKYSQVTKILEKKEYLLIRVDKGVIPIIKTEDNAQQVREMLRIFFEKGVR